MMQTFLDSSAVNLKLPFSDNMGNPISPVSAKYRVLNQANEVLLTEQTIDLTAEPVEADITIDAQYNDLAGERSGLRTIELTMETSSGSIAVLHRYVLEASNIIEVGETSFQTFSEALLEGHHLIGLGAWNMASDHDKRSALIQAYHNLCKLKYSIPESDRDERIYIKWDLVAMGQLSSRIDLREMSIEDVGSLSRHLLNGLKKAQVTEANYLLGGETIEDKRRIGLMSESVGESSNMFRSGKPLRLPVSIAAIDHISGYVNWSVAIQR